MNCAICKRPSRAVDIKRRAEKKLLRRKQPRPDGLGRRAIQRRKVSKPTRQSNVVLEQARPFSMAG